jgi:electron transport complex protein RnfE
MSTSYRTIVTDGLWTRNVILAQILSLCPTTAVTTTATNGLGMGLATTAVLVSSGLFVSLLRQVIAPTIRIPAFVLIMATLVTLVDMAINAFAHDLYKVLGLFIPLIVVNCAILGRAEAFASKNPVLPSIVDGLFMGLGFTLVLMTIGGIREVLGSGKLFASASLLLGPNFGFLETVLFPHYQGMLLMILPPGGFIVLGFLIALKRVIDTRRAAARRRAGEPAGAAAAVAGE